MRLILGARVFTCQKSEMFNGGIHAFRAWPLWVQARFRVGIRPHLSHETGRAFGMRYAFLILLLPSFALAQAQPPVQGFFCESGQLSPCASACQRWASWQDDKQAALKACAEKCEKVCAPKPPLAQVFEGPPLKK